MVLSTEDQDAIIKKRLEVDERPLKRLTKCVLQATRGAPAETLAETDQALGLAFETYNLTLRRLNLLLQENSKEVNRYHTEAQSVTQTHLEAVQEVESLKAKLLCEQEAQSNRASYDVIARSIQSTAPKTRKTLRQNISKLEEEVAELEREKANYNAVWQTRKSGFSDIMAQLSKLQEEISGEKADAELRDAADSDDEEGAIRNTGESPDASSTPGEKGTESVPAAVFSQNGNGVKDEALASHADGDSEPMDLS